MVSVVPLSAISKFFLLLTAAPLWEVKWSSQILNIKFYWDPQYHPSCLVWVAQDYDCRPHVTDTRFWQVRSTGCWDNNHQPLELSHNESDLGTSLTRKTEIKICLTNTTPLMKNEDLKWLYTLGPSLQACRWGPLSVPGMEIEFFLPVLEKINILSTKMSLQEKASWNRCIFPLNENSDHSAFTLTPPFTFSS